MKRKFGFNLPPLVRPETRVLFLSDGSRKSRRGPKMSPSKGLWTRGPTIRWSRPGLLRSIVPSSTRPSSKSCGKYAPQSYEPPATPGRSRPVKRFFSRPTYCSLDLEARATNQTTMSFGVPKSNHSQLRRRATGPKKWTKPSPSSRPSQSSRPSRSRMARDGCPRATVYRRLLSPVIRLPSLSPTCPHLKPPSFPNGATASRARTLFQSTTATLNRSTFLCQQFMIVRKPLRRSLGILATARLR
jgi:hypothetical protein